jgi:gluconokinase
MQKMNYYIGIDIGTTSTKAVAFSNQGEVLAKESIGYTIQHPHPNYSEQDPEEIFEAVVNSITKITATLHNHIPVLISFSAAMHSILAVDTAGKPIIPCIIWADNRAGETAERLRKTGCGNDFYHATGVPIHAMSPLCKLLWMKEHNPAVFQQAYKFIGIKEYIFFRLFGKYLVDTAIASATGLLNIYTLQWDQNILDYAGIRQQQLSEVTPGTHKEFLSKNNGHAPGTLLAKLSATAFIIGGSDGALANLGSGATDENSMAITIGTSSAVRVVSQQVRTDEQMRTFCYHLSGNSYIIGGASNNGAVVLQWLKDTLLQTADTHEQLFSEAAGITAGCNGLVFVPYILGERAPVWNSGAKGVFFGLNIMHTRAHLIRSAMEAVVYSVYSIGTILMEKRTITEIHATGGFTQSSLWLQMLSDMFNCTVRVSEAVESSALGAVKIGMTALGIQPAELSATTQTYTPDTCTHTVYLEQAARMQRIYEILKAEMTGNDHNLSFPS